MKLSYKYKLITNEDKEKLAQKLSYVVCGYHFIPYRPNEDDYNFWTLDEGNNWKLSISQYEVGIIDIYYRYSRAGSDMEPQLIEYLVARWDQAFEKVKVVL